MKLHLLACILNERNYWKEYIHHMFSLSSKHNRQEYVMMKNCNVNPFESGIEFNGIPVAPSSFKWPLARPYFSDFRFLLNRFLFLSDGLFRLFTFDMEKAIKVTSLLKELEKYYLQLTEPIGDEMRNAFYLSTTFEN